MPDNFILSLLLEDAVENKLTQLRERYFPPERNFLRAHITLFHALPDGADWRAHLETVARAQPGFTVAIGDPYPLGRGVALRIISPELLRLRDELARPWFDFLSPQDRQRYNPHCTLQNKVEPANAKAALAEIRELARPREARALGLSLWRYRGGPWEHAESYEFI